MLCQLQQLMPSVYTIANHKVHARGASGLRTPRRGVSPVDSAALRWQWNA